MTLPHSESGPMPLRGDLRPRDGTRWVLALLVFQAFCLIVLVIDVAGETLTLGRRALNDTHILGEALAVLGLVAAVVFVAKVAWAMQVRQRQMEKGLSVASGALGELIEGYFASWGLTPTEHDVATFTIKGYSITEIAGLRGSAEGTIKTHLNAIYRKAGVNGRAQLVSLLIEDLMRAPLVPGAGGKGEGRAADQGP